MTRDHTTPGELADLLRVTGRTVQRMGNAYIEVFGPDALLPDPRHRDHRVFPPVAVERLQRAADLTRLHRGLSTRQALESIRDGQELAKPRTRPAPAASDALVERLLEEVQRLQVELVTLRRDLLDRYAPERPDTAPPAPTPDPDPAPVAASPSRPAQRPARRQAKRQRVEVLHEGETGHTPEVVSESDPALARGPELPQLKGRAAELYQRLLDGAELADNDPTFMVVKDGKAMGTVPRATAQRLLAMDGLLVQVAPGRWALVPRLIPGQVS